MSFSTAISFSFSSPWADLTTVRDRESRQTIPEFPQATMSLRENPVGYLISSDMLFDFKVQDAGFPGGGGRNEG